MPGAEPLPEVDLAALAARSADPARVDAFLGALPSAAAARLEADTGLAAAAVAAAAASRHLARVVASGADAALDVLDQLDRRPAVDATSVDGLRRWRDLEQLRIATLDLTGRSTFEDTVLALSDLAADVLTAAVGMAGATELAVIGMGKLGGREINYSSDVDVVLVAPDGDPRHVQSARRLVTLAGAVVRIDTALRPEGRDGPVVRSLAAYDAHWRRWAEPWEFQALLKARGVAGNEALARRFERLAARRLWSRSFSADDLRSLRALKRRGELAASHGGRPDRWELKRSPGGIRDIEFAAQLLQLVHGQHDPELRVRATLPALVQLAAGGYVAEEDAAWLGRAYRHLRRLEHAVQLDDDRQTHSLPADARERHRVARVVGYRDRPRSSALEELDAELAACRAAVRATHERLYFRPLLEAFSGTRAPLSAQAAAARLAAFGFTDVDRTRQAVTELSRGLTRSSRLMQQLLPLLLDWLSATADPDLGLLALRRLTTGPTRAMELATAFRESPETARRACTVLGSSRRLGDLLVRHPDLIDALGTSGDASPGDRGEAAKAARDTIVGRQGGAVRRALGRHVDRAVLRIAADDLLGDADDRSVGRRLTTTADAALDALVDAAGAHDRGHDGGHDRGLDGANGLGGAPVPEPVPVPVPVPVAVIALGRFGGRELSYASDLDVAFVHAGGDHGDARAAERTVARLVRTLRDGDDLLAAVDVDLRPEGRAGPLVRTVEGYLSYFERWAEPWERLAWTRARPAAGDLGLAEDLLGALRPRLEARPTGDELRSLRRIKARAEAERIPPGEDPDFHLKLGPGGLTDVELCVQLLQLQHGVVTAGTTTAEGIAALAAAGVLNAAEAGALADAHRFCASARNRWTLLRGARGDALPSGDDLARLARSLATSPSGLRDEFRRVTRRARRVVERRFYGTAPPAPGGRASPRP
ncbi:MAG: bifunctional [glutamine synthetase] adenylyltransferase/[glutamine synthetase]-adenylyl-L-tyrosine phosphorylase [Actinobacteria bacterium]|nr:bifunctional [glutamine synthetase] adenylyltransferase/[glutamine synthetase]-adenylyl-L-tyrosine phosphorylase [Actinomycetota bacterium]